MADDTRVGGLRTIFSFFLGLMLTAFIGVGAYTFHPPPTQLDDQLRDLGRREQAIRDARPADQLTPEDRAQLKVITDERDALQDTASAARKAWGRSTSIILIVLATVAMAFSLVRADELPVLSNGLLVGGVFTMIYGIGWIIASDRSIARFVVITLALLVTLALGYARFVRRGQAAPAMAGALPGGSDALVNLERRVRDLEARVNDAASALARRNDGS